MTKTSFAYSKGKPLVEVVVHGKLSFDVVMVVDTGADLVSLSPRLCQSLGWKVVETREVIVPSARIRVPIYKGVIEFLGVRKEVKVMAVELPDFKTADGLLGREFLDLFEVCFKGGKRVTFDLFE